MLTIDSARAWYPESDPVHGFDHVLRVFRLAERLAQAEGADLEIVRAAVLLHDAEPPAGPALDGEARRVVHHHASAEFAAQVLEAEGWPAERIAAVQHAIRAHRFRDTREPPATLEARVLYDADKLDAIGLTGAARAIAFAARRGQPAYFPPSERFLAENNLEPGEPYSAYHEFCFKLSKIKDRLHTATASRLAEARHRQMAEFFDGLRREAGDLTNSQSGG